jgi:hypothetical protein
MFARRALPVLLVMLAPGAALAQDWSVDDQASTPPRNWGNLRAGASSANENGRPEICLEVAPLARLSIEACGTGSGFLHDDPDPEMATFMAKWRLFSWNRWGLWFEPQIGLGFAELQLDADAPGFQFGGVGPDGVSTAGPAAGAYLRVLYPLGQVELVGTLHLTAAYLEHAPDLVRPRSRFLPGVMVTVGVGF